MVRLPLLAAAAALLAAPAFAQEPSHNSSGPNGTSAVAQVNTDNSVTSKVTADHMLRSSKVVGSAVYDEHHNEIGTIDDLLLTPAMKGEPLKVQAVLSVGGFVGIGSKLVKVSYGSLKVNKDGYVVLPNATKESLKAMADYRYNANS